MNNNHFAYLTCPSEIYDFILNDDDCEEVRLFNKCACV
jgi:hypothetical protein